MYERVCPRQDCLKVTRRPVDTARHEAKCGVRSVDPEFRTGRLPNFERRTVDRGDEIVASNPVGALQREGAPSTRVDSEGQVGADCSSGSEDSLQEGDDGHGEDSADDDDDEVLDFGGNLRVEEQELLNPGEDAEVPPAGVSYLQYKAAKYICSSGPSKRGLSQKESDAYLKSLDSAGTVRGLWNTGAIFWRDHAARQRKVLHKFGKWLKCTINTDRPGIGDYIAYIRDLPSTISSVISNARVMKIDGKEITNWERHLKTEPRLEHNSEGQRILTDWYSGDDFLNLKSALSTVEDLSEVTLVPIQLFVDKANVTRLNKRSMYPVVLYILCFSRKVRRLLAVNVAFIPIIRKTSISGKRLSRAQVNRASRTIIQTTLSKLLSPLRPKSRRTVAFPDGFERTIRAVLLSCVADAPEVAVLQGSRFGTKTSFPCPRCFIALDDFGEVGIEDDLLKTSENLRSVYLDLDRLGTTVKNFHLKELSLHNPPSFLMERFEVRCCEANGTGRSSQQFHGRPFLQSSMTKFEAMHNFDLGLSADILRSIEEYFSVLHSASVGRKITDIANHHQAMLPRRSQTANYRLPAVGKIIAKSHANVTAQNYFSSMCILPFILNGAEQRIEGSSRTMTLLLKCVLTYLELHHFVRRVNTVPWHIYSTVEQKIMGKTQSFYVAYKESLGLCKGRKAGTGPASTPSPIRTLKAHQLACHVGRDIKGAGNVQNYDAQLGESHHISTRAHFNRTGKRESAEEEVAKRATTREIGVLESLYPCFETCESQGSDAEEQNLGSENLPSAKRSRRSRVELSLEICDGLEKKEFQEELIACIRRSEGNESHYTYRTQVSKLRLAQTAKILAKYPWLSDGTTGAGANVDGIEQLVRASPSFYNEMPQYDFVEVKHTGDTFFAQLRLIFEQPYEDKLEDTGLLLCLVRVLKTADTNGEQESSNPNGSFERRTDLFSSFRCSHLKWKTLRGNVVRRIVPVKDILRAVSVVPDFRFPLRPERKSKLWEETSLLDAEKDKARYNREERARQRRLADLTERGMDTSRIPVTLAIRSHLQGPKNLPLLQQERFFYNPYMPWTKPSNSFC